MASPPLYTLSLHDALPIWRLRHAHDRSFLRRLTHRGDPERTLAIDLQGTLRIAAVSKTDRKSTRLNSSHANISYAVFCLKKKKNSKRRTSYRKLSPQASPT